MKRMGVFLIVLAILAGILPVLYCYNRLSGTDQLQPPGELCDTCRFELRAGDMIARSNWDWLPGTCLVPGGRKFGHLAVVVEGYSGTSPEDALQHASVVEALIYDQVTGSFEFRKDKQLIERSARLSFGPKFKGMRYRLRTMLTESQVVEMKRFLRNQIGKGYKIFSSKRIPGGRREFEALFAGNDKPAWNCASLAWEAFYLSAGIDLDANGGMAVYPNDIISGRCFNQPGGRIRF